MKAKKAFICKSAFLKSPASYNQEPYIIVQIADLKYMEKQIAYTFISQSTTKTSSSNKIGFQIFCILL